METPRPGVRPGTAAARTRARLARAYQLGRDTQIPDLERELWIETATDYIIRLVEAAPPLTAEQRDELARLLAGPQPAAPEARGGAGDATG